MRFPLLAISLIIAPGLFAASPQDPRPPAAQQSGGQRGGGGGRGGGGVQIMNLITTAWPDGGMIPLRYSQAGPEISPAIQWSGAPAGTASFVLIFHDADTLAPNSTD